MQRGALGQTRTLVTRTRTSSARHRVASGAVQLWSFPPKATAGAGGPRLSASRSFLVVALLPPCPLLPPFGLIAFMSLLSPLR